MARAQAKTNHHHKPSQQKPAIPAPVVTSPSPIAQTPPAAVAAPAAPVRDVKPEPEAQAARPGPSTEQIAARAYELFQERGGDHGRHEDDWHQAERELKLGR